MFTHMSIILIFNFYFVFLILGLHADGAAGTLDLSILVEIRVAMTVTECDMYRKHHNCMLV